MEPNPPNLPAPNLPPSKTIWLGFLALLLVPALLALLAAMARADGLAIACPLIGGGIAGIAWGNMLGRRLGRTAAAKILFGVILAAGFGFLTLGLGFMGCMLGGFKLDFR